MKPSGRNTLRRRRWRGDNGGLDGARSDPSGLQFPDRVLRIEEEEGDAKIGTVVAGSGVVAREIVVVVVEGYGHSAHERFDASDVMIASRGLGGIILEHATMDDVGDGTLHLRGSVPVFVKYDRNGMGEGDVYGLLYHPGVFYGRRGTTNESRDDDDDGEVGKDGNGSDDGERRESLLRTIAPFQWYASILRTTLDSVPVLHCQW